MRTGKSCMENQWGKIWFLNYKAVKGMNLKLHILIFYISYTEYIRKRFGSEPCMFFWLDQIYVAGLIHMFWDYVVTCA